jgi:hypothetical protein
MAIKNTTKANTEPRSEKQPYGDIKDRIPNVQNGTPVNRNVYGDTHQFLQGLLDLGYQKPNGIIDNAEDGFQLLDGLAEFCASIHYPRLTRQFFGATATSFLGDFNKIEYSSGVFVRIGINSPNGLIATTQDGIAHMLVRSSNTFNPIDIASAKDGRFMIVTTGANARFVYSNDKGATWVDRVSNLPNNTVAVTHITGDTWVAISFATGNTTVHITTDNGLTVTNNVINSFKGNDIAYNSASGEIAIVGYGNTNDSSIAVHQGITADTWTILTHTGNNNEFVKVIPIDIFDNYDGYTGNGFSPKRGFIAITNNANTSTTLGAFFSVFQPVTDFVLSNKNYKSIAYGNGRLVLLSQGASNDANIEFSFDFLQNVQSFNNSLGTGYNDIVFGKNRMLIVGNDVTNQVMR